MPTPPDDPVIAVSAGSASSGVSIAAGPLNPSEGPGGPSNNPSNGEALLRAEIAALRERIKHLETHQLKSRDLFEAQPGLNRPGISFLPVGTWDWDLGTNEVLWSRELFVILGYDPEQDKATVDAYLAALHPEDRAIMGEAVERAMATGIASRFSLRVVWRDGRVRHIQSDGIVLRNAEGKAVRMLGFLIDVTDFVLQEEGSRQTMQLLHEAQLLANAGSWIWDLDQGWVEWSAGIWRIVGEPPRPRISLAESLAHIHAEDRGRLRADAEKVMQGHMGQLESRYRVVRPDGAVRQVMHRSRMLQTGSNSSRLRLGTVLDITESQQIEETLRRNNQILNDAQLLGQTGYWIWNLDTGKVEWSDPLCKITGVEPGGQSNIRDVIARVHPDDRARVGQAMRSAEEGAGEMVMEFRVRHTDGSLRHILQRSRPYASEEHGASRMRLGTMADITELRRAESKSAQAHHIAKTALKLAKAGSWAAKPGERTAIWSDDLYALTGVVPGTPITADFILSMVHPDDRAEIKAREGVRSGDQDLFWPPFRFIRPDNGDVRHLEIQGHLVKQGDGDEGLIIGITIDVTERLRLEEAQRQKQKLEAIGRLAGGVAHDFNNLLTVMLGHAEELNAAQPQERLEQILKAGRLGAALTHRLLAFSRQAVVRPQSIDLSGVVGGMASMMSRLLGEDIEIRYDLGQDLGHVSADVGQVEQVLLNLAINARDAMPQGGQLRVETRRVEKVPEDALPRLAPGQGENIQPYFQLVVEDTGTGMNPEILDRLYEPFFTTKEMGKGTGLGLSTVLGIISEAGGRIAVRSQLGRGTRFEVFWPLQMAAAAKEQAPAETDSAIATGQGKVAVVEDNPELRRLLVEMLQTGGYAVTHFATPEEAVAADRESVLALDALVTDLVMPGLHGQVVAQRLREKKPGLHVLFISGYPRLDLEGELDGDFLQKPFNRSQLLGAVAALMAKKS